MRIPVDSAEAAELREAEHEREREAAANQVRHAERCVDGWLGEDDQGRPIACTLCRPSLVHVPCRLCSVPYAACAAQQARHRGACCEGCEHSRRSVT